MLFNHWWAKRSVLFKLKWSKYPAFRKRCGWCWAGLSEGISGEAVSNSRAPCWGGSPAVLKWGSPDRVPLPLVLGALGSTGVSFFHFRILKVMKMLDVWGLSLLCVSLRSGGVYCSFFSPCCCSKRLQGKRNVSISNVCILECQGLCYLAPQCFPCERLFYQRLAEVQDFYCMFLKVWTDVKCKKQMSFIRGEKCNVGSN